jgi:glycosyltransferase involved in cell wall biosynthesis
MSDAIRAAHIVRPDHSTRFGGDIVHLRANVRSLRDEGVDAFETTWDDAPADADIVHLYNVDLPLTLRRHVRDARRRWPRAKVVITPIFWPWRPSTLLRAHEPAILYRAVRNAAKAWSTWFAVRAALREADAITAYSHREIEMLSRYFRIGDVTSWYAAPSAVWVRDWPARQSPPDRRRIAAELGLGGEPTTVVACVGRLEPLKNQHTLVKGVAQVPGAALVLVGANGGHGYGARVVRLGHRLLPGRFAWVDRVPHDDVQRLLADVDVHALVSFREVASLSSLEAAAAGCELVVTTWSSTEEYYDNDVHYADAASPRSIAAAIERATAAPRQPELRARIEQRFDWSVSARVIATCYRTMLAERA